MLTLSRLCFLCSNSITADIAGIYFAATAVTTNAH
jgi:hypothetical protein